MTGLPRRSVSSTSLRDRIKKAFIGSGAVDEAGKLLPKSVQESGILEKEDDGALGPIIGILTKAANDDAKATGIMVALMLSEEDAQKFVIPGGEQAQELHVTLAYMGKVPNLPPDTTARVARALGKATKSFGVIDGVVSGIGRFNGSASSDDQDVVYASYDSPALHALRDKIVQALEKEGVAPKNNHGFTPHITLAYVGGALPNPVTKIESTPLKFSEVTLVSAGIKQTFPLTASVQKCAPMYAESQPSAQGDVGAHSHLLLRSASKTATDGAHTHEFILPNGTMLYTMNDGQHAHALSDEYAASAKEEREHTHIVRLQDGSLVETTTGTPHWHEAFTEHTSYSGTHTHNLILADGTELKTATSADFWRLAEEERSRRAAINAVIAGQEQVGKAATEYDAVINIPILKANQDKRLVTGVVLEPDEVDAQKDTISPDVIELAAYNFLSRYNRSSRMGAMHRIFGEIGVDLVESYVTREDTVIGDKPVKKGSWVITVKVMDDMLWSKIKSGVITGFSIGGIATRI